MIIVHSTHFFDVKENLIPQEKVRNSAIDRPYRIKVSQNSHGTEGDCKTVSNNSLVVLMQKIILSSIKTIFRIIPFVQRIYCTKDSHTC